MVDVKSERCRRERRGEGGEKGRRGRGRDGESERKETKVCVCGGEVMEGCTDREREERESVGGWGNEWKTCQLIAPSFHGNASPFPPTLVSFSLSSSPSLLSHFNLFSGFCFSFVFVRFIWLVDLPLSPSFLPLSSLISSGWPSFPFLSGLALSPFLVVPLELRQVLCRFYL